MVSDSNLSVVLYGKNDMRLEVRPKPNPKPNQLLIKVHTVGICGSDVHYWTHGAIGRFVVTKPMVLGHECSGTIVEVGSEVCNFQKGDRVAIEPGIPCRICEFCKTGKYNLCDSIAFFATPPFDGSLARYIVHDADFCFRLPDSVTMEEGSLIEPLSVAIHSCRRAHITAGVDVLILGAGPIGLLCLLAAKAFGAARVVITDILDNRLELAKELGAVEAINVKDMNLPEATERIQAAFDGMRPRAAIECTGSASSTETAISCIKSGGTLVIVGLAADRMNLPMVEATIREVDIRGIFRYANCYPTAIQMVASRSICLDKLSRAHFKLEQSEEAFKKCLQGDVVKVFIHCDDSD